MALETPLLRNKSSRLLPCHRGVFGVNVEPVEVCSSSVGLPDRVPASVRTWKCVCRAIAHGKYALLCPGARQSSPAHGKGLARTANLLCTAKSSLLPPCTLPAAHTLSLSQPYPHLSASSRPRPRPPLATPPPPPSSPPPPPSSPPPPPSQLTPPPPTQQPAAHQLWPPRRCPHAPCSHRPAPATPAPPAPPTPACR
jgi:hypothetical protein